MTILIELLCLILMAWAAILSLYRPPNFDWRKSFLYSLSGEGKMDPMDTYPPCLGQTWTDPDMFVIQSRHIHVFRDVVIFVIDEPNDISTSWGQYLEKKIHIVHPQVEDIAKHVVHRAQRLLFLCVGSKVQEMLKVFHKHPGMRDILFGVVVIDPEFDVAWMEQYFGQDSLDAEANSPIPYVFCFSVEEKIIMDPKDSTTGWQSIRCINLGVLPEKNKDKLPLAFSSLFSALYS